LSNTYDNYIVLSPTASIGNRKNQFPTMSG